VSTINVGVIVCTCALSKNNCYRPLLGEPTAAETNRSSIACLFNVRQCRHGNNDYYSAVSAVQTVR